MFSNIIITASCSADANFLRIITDSSVANRLDASLWASQVRLLINSQIEVTVNESRGTLAATLAEHPTLPAVGIEMNIQGPPMRFGASAIHTRSKIQIQTFLRYIRPCICVPAGKAVCVCVRECGPLRCTCIHTHIDTYVRGEWYQHTHTHLICNARKRWAQQKIKRAKQTRRSEDRLKRQWIDNQIVAD